MTKLLEGGRLEQRARELGVDIKGELITQSAMGRHRASDYEIQRRVAEAERNIRESRLWIVALISAIASLVSAIAAWVAVLKK
jgi:hypothetical protein